VNSLPQSTPGNLTFSPPSLPPKRIVASVYIRATRSCSPGRAVCPLKSPWAHASLFLSRKRRGCYSIPDPGKKTTRARGPYTNAQALSATCNCPEKRKTTFNGRHQDKKRRKKAENNCDPNPHLKEGKKSIGIYAHHLVHQGVGIISWKKLTNWPMTTWLASLPL